MNLKHAHARSIAKRDHRDLPLHLVDLKIQQANKTDPFEFEGYGSVWDNVDSYGDTMIKGAFTESLKERRPMMFFGHSPGRVPGKWVKYKEDDIGLFLRGQLTPGHSEAADLEASLRHESINGLSVGGYTIKADWIEEDGKIVGRKIKQFDLYEVSIVSMPAEGEARIDGQSVKAMLDECETPAEMEDLLREVTGISKSTAIAFIARMRRISRGEPGEVDAGTGDPAAKSLLDAMRGVNIPTSLTGA